MPYITENTDWIDGIAELSKILENISAKRKIKGDLIASEIIAGTFGDAVDIDIWTALPDDEKVVRYSSLVNIRQGFRDEENFVNNKMSKQQIIDLFKSK